MRSKENVKSLPVKYRYYIGELLCGVSLSH
jgi:hypothetical protein